MPSPSSVAFALITFYPYWYPGKLGNVRHIDKVRGDLALEFITKATQLGFQVVVVDGKSYDIFHEALKKITGIKLLRRENDSALVAKHLAIREASKIKNINVIIATEPEKVSLLDSIDKLITPITNNEADVVIPSRQENLFKESYPDFQYISESKGNKIYNTKLGIQGFDFFFGPRIFINNSKVVKIFLYNSKDEFSGWSIIPIISAIKKLKVVSIEIPFIYPPLQLENEAVANRQFFIEKRQKQYRQLIAELNQFLK